jgi:NADP-dependent aldehyde dehydrogenase
MTFRAISPLDAEPYGSPIQEYGKEQTYALIERAHAVAPSLAALSPESHASLLLCIASEIEAKRESLIETACAESGLPVARISGEVTRTVVQFKLFAELVKTGQHLRVVIDKADPNYSPAPRPDIRKLNQPLGVVAIFAASNFPLAFSVAGGDSASAIASGNAVVAKAHPSHPNTCALVETAIKAALIQSNLSTDLFSIVQGTNPEITHWLATHPLISAIGFTGSETVGRILIDLAAKREKPIPVFAEMGSINPIFISSSAINERCEALAKGVVDSALLGSGQFCTKPGLIFAPDMAEFFATIKDYVASLSVAPLLNGAIFGRYNDAMSTLASIPNVEVVPGVSTDNGFGVTPTFFFTDWETAQSHQELLNEHFGPTTVVIRASEDGYCEIAQSLDGQLTSTIHGTESDSFVELIKILAEKSGRVLWNGFPTGVAVTAAMNHGGPWPASSSHTTSVGIDAIYRFMRPVAYQGFLDAALPIPLKDSNPWGVPQEIS